MRELNPTSFQQAVLVGARINAHVTGKTYFRRRLTTKQQKLLALVASGDSVGIEELSGTFHAEWTSLRRKKRGSPESELHQAFFQNIADIASRINEYLIAGYGDPQACTSMHAELGSGFVGLFCDHQRHEIWTAEHPTTDEFMAAMGITIPRRRRQRKASRPRPDPLPETAQPESETVDPPAVTATESLPEPDPRPVVEPILAAIDPVTRRWTIDLGAGLVEVDTRLGLVRVSGLLVPWQGEPLPEDPQALTPRQLAALRDLL